MIRFTAAAMMILCLFFAPFVGAQQEMTEAEKKTFRLITATPEEGFQLAIELARKRCYRNTAG